MEEMELFNIAMLLFSLIFSLVLLIFLAISTLLIHSLLLLGVETTAFDGALLRMLGLSKTPGLIIRILI